MKIFSITFIILNIISLITSIILCINDSETFCTHCSCQEIDIVIGTSIALINIICILIVSLPSGYFLSVVASVIALFLNLISIPFLLFEYIYHYKNCDVDFNAFVSDYFGYQLLAYIIVQIITAIFVWRYDSD